jgi:hypothetical protein
LTPPDPKEDELQASIINVLHYALHGKPVVMEHFPAGGYGLSPAAQGRLKRLGLVAGFPDLVFMWEPSRVLLIEIKTRKGRLSEAQERMHALLASIGFRVSVCRSVEEVLWELQANDVPMNRINIQGRRSDSYGYAPPEGSSTQESP